MSKANQLLEQIHEEGIRQSLAEEVENLKAATNKADADLDEVNSQVKDVLTRIASALQQEKENAEQDPQTLVLYQKLYDILMSLHSYLESNNGSDADFDKVDALLDQLSAKSKDKTALLEPTKAILVLNHQIFLAFISYDANDGINCTFHSLKANVFKTSVHIFATCKDIRSWDSHKGNLRAVCSTPDWFDNRRDT